MVKEVGMENKYIIETFRKDVARHKNLQCIL